MSSSGSNSLLPSILPADINLHFTRGYDPSNLGRQDDPNYEAWTVLQLRRECTRRTLRPPQNLRKNGLIQLLRDHDRTSPEVLTWLGRPVPAGAVANAPRRTQHCAFRLLNLLFSDEFSADFAASGDTLSKSQLDDVQSRRHLAFWNRIATANRTERDDCNSLIASDTLFAQIDPSHIVPHDGFKLRVMWKEINQGFVTATAAFRQSGTHESDFRNFVRGRADVLYLWHWLQVKPQLSDFVHGGMLARDQYDSLDNEEPLVIVEERRRVVHSNVDIHNGASSERTELQLAPAAASTRSTDTTRAPESTPQPRREPVHSPETQRVLFNAASPTPTVSSARTTSSRDSTPMRFMTPRTHRRNRKAQASDYIRSMSKTLATIVSRRNAAAVTTPSTSDRVAAFQLLDNLRSRISEMEQQLEATINENTRARLESDLAFYLRERERLMDELQRE